MKIIVEYKTNKINKMKQNGVKKISRKKINNKKRKTTFRFGYQMITK